MKIVTLRLWSSSWLVLLYSQTCLTAEFTLGMDSETSCTKTHYYEAGDVFIASASGMVHGGHCPLTFIQASSWRTDGEAEPCLSLCIRILSYTMESCSVAMSYHDGLNDFDPVTFDCHTFPPLLWCSSKTDLKLTVSELKSYQGKNYAITLEVKPFCGKYDHPTTDPSVIAEPRSNPNQMSQTALIVGAVVGTVSILFVCGWLLYCYKKRQSEREPTSSRNTHSRTPNLPASRYPPPSERNPPSSHSGSDRGPAPPYRPPLDGYIPTDNPRTYGQERRIYSPFQPTVTTTEGTPFTSDRTPQPFYSDLYQGPVDGGKWYPMTPLASTQNEPTPPVKFSLPNDPVTPYNTQQVYKYPQFNQDSEMHTAPTDTRYVVYDFDYPRPMERTYSAGKSRQSPLRDSPIKDISSYQRPREITPPVDFTQRLREITPLRETVRVMHPETTTTENTSDNDSSLTDSSDYATDDQFIPTRPYHVVPAYQSQGRTGFRPPNSNMRYYDPANFQRVDSAKGGQRGNSQEPGAFQKIPSYGNRDKNSNSGPSLPFRENISPSKQVSSLSYGDFISHSREGPVPQVPPLPKNLTRPQTYNWEPNVSQPSMQSPPQAQESGVSPVPGQFSNPRVVNLEQEALASEPLISRPTQPPHDGPTERRTAWPEGGPPPYSEEQADLV